MKRHGDLYMKICSRENIVLAYQRACKGKGRKKSVIKFDKDYEKNIDGIQNLLTNKLFQTAHYVIKTIFEPKKREIYILPFNPDRIVQHAIMNVLEPIWEGLFINDSYSCRKGFGLHAGSRKTMEYIRKVGRDGYCLKMDISKFYPSMDHEVLFNIIERKIKCRDTLELLRNIIFSVDGDRNVPIGNYTSQWFGNLYMNELDQFLKHKQHVKYYVRYCDDFIILDTDKKKLQNLVVAIRDYLETELQLKLSKCDLFPIKNGIDFLGYRHFNNYVLLRKSTSKRIKKHLVNVTEDYQRGKITKDVFRSVIASVSGWLKWANSYHLRRTMNIGLLEEMAHA